MIPPDPDPLRVVPEVEVVMVARVREGNGVDKNRHCGKRNETKDGRKGKRGGGGGFMNNE